ncbi:Yip1 family protein [Rhodanobacter sp. C03]|uniref:Yip1 family protein n=1 Tax=Rhodanobacter sp. C03 TaxID=1945858 RepID=UPI0009866477|nr:Yip1 family protein [Rhodanobacter sp. C03]OOG53768.1 YIP1 family protein [Rhodanobacter sp. C03]
MDFGKIIERIKAILTTPRTEWPIAAAEPASVGGLYAGYIAIVAALPSIAGFIKGSLIGYGGFGITIRTPFTLGITAMVLGYVLSLVMTYVVALIVNAFAPSFGGQKDQTQALKTIAYAWTAYWIASIGSIVPWLGWLIGIAGGVYSIYLLYLGLSHTMKCPPDKAAGYTAVTVVVAIVLGWIIGLVVAGVIGTAALTGGAMSGMNISGSNGDNSSVSIDSNSALGKLAAMGQQAEQASKQLDAAQKSGDSAAQSAAMGKMMGAVSGTNGSVEALAPDQIKTFLPDSLGSLKRTSISAQRNSAMGMQVSDASAEYSNDSNQHITLDVTDTGGAKGFVAMAAAMAPEEDKETDHGYDKTHTVDGNLVHEAWDTQSKSGEYSVVLGQRFTVKATGNADSIDQLKQAVASVDLSKLESMKDAGVKSN